MFLLERLDFIALVGLFVQAFLAWVFVAVLASLRKRDPSRALDSFALAFACLSLGLTALSVRFFRAHDVVQAQAWNDGHLASTLAYVLYQGFKAWFALLIVRGCHRLAGRAEPAWLGRAWWPVVGACAASPLAIGDISQLLVVQAPVMVGAAILASRALREVPPGSPGLRMMRWSLAALGATWTVHALAALGLRHVAFAHRVMSFNSLLDLAVQLVFGTGLIVGILHAASRRAREAEQQSRDLQRAIERDERLRSLGTLVSGVAHELNNPLTVILAHAETMAREDPRAEVLREQAERCRGIVHSLSALAVQKPDVREDLDPTALFERVVRGLDPKLLSAGRRVLVAPSSARRVTADRVGIEQVLINVVVNALHASPPGGTVTLAAEDVHDEWVALTVTDAGPGVPQALRTRMFEPFFTTKGPGQGTGLGLAIAHAIVGGHGGTITVDDGPGGIGASLRIVLPRGVPRPGPDARRTLPSVPGPERAPRLLIVDDDEAVRGVLRQRAEREGWSVSEAASAEEALNGAQPLDAHAAVLCDLRMPGIGGIGLHDRLEREAPTLLERFVFVTGDLASRHSAAFSRRCRQPLVSKPFDFAELFAQLERAARAGEPRAADVAPPPPLAQPR
jgi:signal transduction histidine kinase/CheY-like chemotaxis protein